VPCIPLAVAGDGRAAVRGPADDSVVSATDPRLNGQLRVSIPRFEFASSPTYESFCGSGYSARAGNLNATDRAHADHHSRVTRATDQRRENGPRSVIPREP
jgi:hypothetical protein